VEIIIKDNGAGVPDEMLLKLFDVFYRGDMSRSNLVKGSGLGLAISSKIVKRMNGNIRAENMSGLAIIITLPIGKSL
jgi:signal transduction histidine kinase